MTLTVTETQPKLRTKTAVIDCDIHNTLPSNAVLGKYLPARWQRHLEQYGGHVYPGAAYPRLHPNAARADAWPPNGGPPGSDLRFVQQQLLDTWDIEIGVLNMLFPAAQFGNYELAAATAQALNEWQVAEWLEPEPRLRASIVLPYEDSELAVAEIERWANDPRFVQVILVARTREPLGRRKYWPMFEAAAHYNLPVGIHFGGNGGWPITGAGWPSFYYEDHAGMPQAFQGQITSLIYEGVFERFPNMKVVLIEGGFAWLPPLMWRLDRLWQEKGAEIPHVTRLPSETIREHFWITTQPIEEPNQPAYFRQLLDQLGMNDRLLFATDYPHWDFDAPDQALPHGLSAALKQAIMADNARQFYRF
jgi:predicted TIM-barrel fold metal-dependent hydrolase